MLLHSRQIGKCQKRYLAAFRNLLQPFILPLPPIPFIKKPLLLWKFYKNIIKSSHILYYTSETNGLTPTRDTLPHFKSFYRHLCHHSPQCNILTSSSFVLTCMLLHIRQIDYHHKKIPGHMYEICHQSPPPSHNVIL